MTEYRLPSTDHRLPFKVLLKKGEFVDLSRNGRTVPYKIYYPENPGEKLPVIIWSHGYGGNRDGAGFISRYIAGQGYTIVHLTHPGSDSSLWEGKKIHPWEVLKKTPLTQAMALDRFRDVPFAVDQLQEWAQQNPDVGAAMDFSKLGMSGHSFGAMTSQAMAGQLFQDEEGVLRSFADDRFKAGILYSPVPIRELTHEKPEPHIYGPIKLPLFHMTGTDDDSPLEGFNYKRRVAVYDYSGPADKYLKILNKGDHMVYNGTRGQLEVNPLRPQHEELIKVSSLAFWDAYLKDDKNALEWLKNGGFEGLLGEAGTFHASVDSAR